MKNHQIFNFLKKKVFRLVLILRALSLLLPVFQGYTLFTVKIILIAILWSKPIGILNHCVKIIQIYQEKIGGEIMMQIQYLYDKINGFKQKNQNFIGRFLQKSTRWQRPWSKMHRIKKQTPLWKTNFLSTTTLHFIPRMIRAL